MGTAQNNAARRAYIAMAERTERQQMARERFTGAARTFITSNKDNDLGAANSKSTALSNLIRVASHMLGMTYDELRFALITSNIFVDACPKTVGDMCAAGVRDFKEDSANPDVAAQMDICNRIVDLVAPLSVEHGWRPVLAGLLSVIGVAWDERKHVDAKRLEVESKRKLAALKSDVKAYRAGHPAAYAAPVVASPEPHNAASNPIVERHYRKVVPVDQQRPAPFTWEEYIRGLTEGPETLINERLDRANAAAAPDPFDDFPEIDFVDNEPIVIRDLDAGRTTQYKPPVSASSRLFSASTDGSVTIRKPYQPDKQTETPNPGDGGAGARNRYWCVVCEEWHGRNDSE